MDARNTLLRDAVTRKLEPLPVTARNMFGGVGLYLEGKYFGFISDGVLYFRTDAASRDEYLKRRMPAFQPAGRPRGPKTVDRNFRVPDDVIKGAALLRLWAMKAAAAAR